MEKIEKYNSTVDFIRKFDFELFNIVYKNKAFIQENMDILGENKRLSVIKHNKTLIFENSLVGLKNIVEYIAFLEKAESMGYEIKCLYLESKCKEDDVKNKILIANKYLMKNENEYLEKLKIVEDNKLKLRQAIYLLKNYQGFYNKQTAAAASGLHRSYLYRHIKVVEQALKE